MVLRKGCCDRIESLSYLKGTRIEDVSPSPSTKSLGYYSLSGPLTATCKLVAAIAAVVSWSEIPLMITGCREQFDCPGAMAS